MTSGNIDWDAWDSFVQGGTMEPVTNNLWPMNMDPAMASGTATTSAPQQGTGSGPTTQGAQQQATFSQAGNMYMGV